MNSSPGKISVERIYRYPVKGLSAERLDRVTLRPGECLPGDRRFAIAHGAAPFDPGNPQWLPKTNFLMLMRDEALAQLKTGFDAGTGFLTVEREGGRVLHEDMTDPGGRRSIERFFTALMGGKYPGGLKVVEAPGHAFADASPKPGARTNRYVHMVNLESIRDLERSMGGAVDPDRFRANFHLAGAAAWSEFAWMDGIISIGRARLKILSRTDRCAATSVNPATAKRDLNVVKALKRHYGHIDMGVYAEVIGGGDIAEGDEVTPPAAA